MDLATLQEVVNNMGFPIVCCGALIYANMKQRKSHKEESDKWIEALNNNTLVITKLVEKLEAK